MALTEYLYTRVLFKAHKMNITTYRDGIYITAIVSFGFLFSVVTMVFTASYWLINL